MPTGNFGDIYAGYVAQRMGLPIDRLVIATNVNDILARTLATGTYELRDVVPTTSPSMDIQVSSNFERLLFDAYDRDAGAVRALMGSLAQSRRFTLSARALSQIRAHLHRRSRRRGRSRRHHAHGASARPAISSIRTPPSALRWRKRKCAIRRCRWWCSRPRIRPNFPKRSRRPAACGRACRTGFAISINVRSASTALPADQSAVERFVLATSRAAHEGAAA